MMPGQFRSSVIYNCTACGQPIREISGSGNNHGMKVWSDGKEECEMRFEKHWLVLCPHCRAPLWMDELEGDEEYDDDDEDEDEDDESGTFPGLPEEGWPDLDIDSMMKELFVDFPDARLNEPLEYDIPAFADYLAVLPSIKEFPEKIHELRLRAWWAGNDARRGKAATALTPAEVKNLEAFIGMLNAGNANEQYTKAEALRELGRFAEAAAVLDTIADPFMGWAVGIVRERVEAGDAIVVLLEGND